MAPVVQQEAPNQPLAPSYTESTPVEDILKVMTFEEAQNVVVDSGLSKGKTMATVAKERPVSLKFYLTPGNKSTNNIVRAAEGEQMDSYSDNRCRLAGSKRKTGIFGRFCGAEPGDCHGIFTAGRRGYGMRSLWGTGRAGAGC